MRKQSIIPAFMLLLVSFAAPVGAQDGADWNKLYTCEGSEGLGYFVGQGLQRELIGKGVIILRKRNEEYDLLVGDAVRQFSVKDDGASIYGWEILGAVQLVAMYKGVTIESYLFSEAKNGKATLIWSSNKVSPLTKRVLVFESRCVVH